MYFCVSQEGESDIWLKLGFLLNVISQVLVCCVCVCLPLAYTRIYTKSGLWKPFLELQLLWRRSNPFVETRSPKINSLFLLSVYSVVGTTVCVQILPPPPSPFVCDWYKISVDIGTLLNKPGGILLTCSKKGVDQIGGEKKRRSSNGSMTNESKKILFRTELGIKVGRKMMMYSSPSSECRSIRYRPATGVKDVII